MISSLFRSFRQVVAPLPRSPVRTPVDVPTTSQQLLMMVPSNMFMLCRLKHSKRQVKRLFTKNPARYRIQNKLAKEQQPPTPEIPPPQFPPIHTPLFLPNGWSAPPTDPIPVYPFSVARTRHKPNGATGFLPVYTKYRKDGTKITTRIKKIKGDRAVFMRELQSFLQFPDTSKFRVRTGGVVEIDENKAREVRQWLAGLGF